MALSVSDSLPSLAYLYCHVFFVQMQNMSGRNIQRTVQKILSVEQDKYFPIVDKSKHTRDEWKIILTLFSQVLFAPISCASVHNFDQYRPSNSLALLLLSVAQGRASERGIRRPKV